MLNSEPAPGLFHSLRKLFDTGLMAVQNRAELLAVEFQEEKENVIGLFLWLVAALFFLITTVLVLSATIILLFPEEFRFYAAGGLTILYLAGAVWSIAGLKKRLKNRALPFSATLEEIKKDREWLLK